MKNSILSIVFISFSSILFGQIYEIGASLGGTNYVGDIGSTNYISPNQFGGAVFFKYNHNPRFAFRGTLSLLPIKGDDDKADTDLKRERGLNFSNLIVELAVGMEYNFYEYDVSSKDKNWTPYILFEIAAFNYSYVKSQDTAENNVYAKKTSFAIPIGVGFKSSLSGNLACSIETKFRYTFKDDLDYTTNEIPSLDFGGTGNDWYMFSGISLIYTFGRPACYASGL
jgi:hypothetical protein